MWLQKEQCKKDNEIEDSIHMKGKVQLSKLKNVKDMYEEKLIKVRNIKIYTIWKAVSFSWVGISTFEQCGFSQSLTINSVWTQSKQ